MHTCCFYRLGIMTQYELYVEMKTNVTWSVNRTEYRHTNTNKIS